MSKWQRGDKNVDGSKDEEGVGGNNDGGIIKNILFPSFVDAGSNETFHTSTISHPEYSPTRTLKINNHWNDDNNSNNNNNNNNTEDSIINTSEISHFVNDNNHHVDYSLDNNINMNNNDDDGNDNNPSLSSSSSSSSSSFSSSSSSIPPNSPPGISRLSKMTTTKKKSFSTPSASPIPSPSSNYRNYISSSPHPPLHIYSSLLLLLSFMSILLSSVLLKSALMSTLPLSS